MSPKLKLFAAGLAVGCLVSVYGTELRAQSAAKKSTKSAVRPAQATGDDVAAPRPRARALPTTKPPAANEPDPSEAEPTERPARPRAEPLRVEKLSPELEQILKDWETHSAQIQKLTGTFERHKYDHVFEVEYQSFGKFAYEMPDKGAYEFEAETLPKDAVSKKLNEDQKPYTLKSDQTERWVCNGKEVLRIDDKTKTYEKVQIPEENQGTNIIEGPLPFLFGMKAEAAKRRYKFELLEGKGKYKDAIWLKVLPKLSKDAMNWREAQVIIDRTTYLPIAVKLIEPSGNADTVHYFNSKDFQVNGKANLFDFFKKRDPFKPDLRKHQLVQNSKPAAPLTAPQQAPATSRPLNKGTASGANKGSPTTSERDDRALPRSADASNGASKKKATSTKK